MQPLLQIGLRGLPEEPRGLLRLRRGLLQLFACAATAACVSGPRTRPSALARIADPGTQPARPPTPVFAPARPFGRPPGRITEYRAALTTEDAASGAADCLGGRLPPGLCDPETGAPPLDSTGTPLTAVVLSLGALPPWAGAAWVLQSAGNPYELHVLGTPALP